MHVLSHRNINLHSSAKEGSELIFIAANTTKVVPDTVAKHPGFGLLVKAGHVVKLADPEPELKEPEPEREDEKPEKHEPKAKKEK